MQGAVPAVPSGEIAIDFVDSSTAAGPSGAAEAAGLAAAAERAAPAAGASGGAAGKTAFYQLEHYTHLFDVDTKVRPLMKCAFVFSKHCLVIISFGCKTRCGLAARTRCMARAQIAGWMDPDRMT